MRPRGRGLLVLAVAGLLGCATVGPDYEAPPVAAPSEWATDLDGRAAADASPPDRWWTLFGDPVLDSLVERAIAGNADLRIALARVREARARLGVEGAARVPSVDVAAERSRTRLSGDSFPAALGGEEVDDWRGGLEASWEVDFVGRIARTVEAAAGDLQATAEDRRAVRVVLVGEVAANYARARGLRRQISVQEASVAAAAESARLTRLRASAGTATEFDAARAESLLAATRAVLPRLEAEFARAVHRIEILAGGLPGDLAKAVEGDPGIPAPPPTLLLGLPADLLRRRPDLRAEERRLAAANARIGAAVAELYPRLTLGAAFGFQGTESAGLADASRRAWTLAGVVRWPLFDGGRTRARVAEREARYARALLEYDRSWREAVEEVENALVGYLREWDRRGRLAESVEADRTAVALSRDLQAAGRVSFLDVLDAERSLFASELALAQSETDLATGAMAVFRSLGCGAGPDLGAPASLLARAEPAAPPGEGPRDPLSRRP